MNIHNFIFITYDQIFGNVFNETDLIDGVHLTEEKNAQLANFIAKITTWQQKKPRFTFNPNPSFLTWVEGIKTGAKNLFKPATKRLAGAAEQPPAQHPDPSGSSPTLRQAPPTTHPPNAMDTDQPPADQPPAAQQGSSKSADKSADKSANIAKAAASAINRLKQAFQKQKNDSPPSDQLPEYQDEDPNSSFDKICAAADAAGQESEGNSDVGEEILDDDDIVEIQPDESGNADNQELYNGVNETG